ncbi:Histidine kinase-like ATPase domain-containing protein [Micromonospora pattaloongensis]|uniref:Histidine kinase-like ATPase domain-containing protein n=1 Tax=Micromonospora pattaloongensis TaxID=405436 RepID=A0A1H3G1Q1_9ACTN|nr:ATP-binding protein [Micromonospora pattaloongensis]SDX97191.1 Histidine kinase-like ATPase domain-containing protein [Micromonospora pattaloongensis]
MPTDVRCLVENDDRYALVRLIGVLDLPAAEAVRSALLTCLADRAGAVVVDVSQLMVQEAAALSIFAAVARETAHWPVGELLLCAPRDADTVWAQTDIAVTPTPQAALARLADPGAAGPLSVDLTPVPGSARRARELVTEGCTRWSLPDLAGPGCIAITEMVNNVVEHARTPMAVRLALRDGALHLAVRDFSPEQPTYAGLVSPRTCGGRGLLLIDTVARRWGSTPLRDGKVVWAVIHPEDEAAR